MPKIINLPQGSPEWKEFRRDKIGASDASVCMGVNPYKNTEKLWYEKVLGKDPFVTEAMKYGSETESIVRKMVNERMKTEYVPVVMQSTSHDFMIASLDGYDKKSIYPIIEIKCPSKEALHLEAVGSIIPNIYLPQLQHQMFVAEEKTALYVSYYGGDLAIVVVKLDPEYCECLVKKEIEFFETIFDWMAPLPPDTIIIEGEDATTLSNYYLEAKATLEKWELILEKAKTELVERCNGKNAIFGNVRVTKEERKGSVDYNQIPELQIVDLDRYRRAPTKFWKIQKHLAISF
jgi:putative phage-type endonuclease